MRTARNTALLLATAALLMPRPAASQMSIGARAFGGYDTYSMGDWNDIRRSLFIPTSLYSRGKDGNSLGGGLELTWGRSLLFTLSYERLTPGRMNGLKINPSDGRLVFDGEKLRLPCNALLLEAEYRRRLRPRLVVGVGAGGGYYQLGEEIESRLTLRNLEGSAFGGQAFALVERQITPATSIGLDLGYRSAKVDVSKVNRQTPPFGIDVDYSGFQSRLVLRLNPGVSR